MDSQEVLQEYNETPNESFMMLLQGECQDYNETPPQPKMRSTTKKTNFSVEEDILLVNAWLNTSIDPIQGNDQKATKFWDRILENYNENKKETTVERTAHSLSNRWCSIQKFTNKFCGFLAQVESTNPSGLNEQDKINKAKAMYREFNNNIIFQFEHCWNLLKTMPKWNSYAVQSKSKRKSFGTSSSSPQDVIHLGEDNNGENASVNLERPLGKKASKEREKKRKSKDCGEKEIMMEVLSGLTEVKKRSHEERKREIDTAKEEIIRIEKQRLEVEFRKEERDQKKEEFEKLKLDVELRKEAREQKKEELEKQKLEVELRKEAREHKRDEFEKEKLEVELRKEAREHKREAFEKEKLDVELRKEAREQKKEEREIMMMDTSHLSEVQLEYIQSLQMEIIKKRKTFI